MVEWSGVCAHAAQRLDVDGVSDAPLWERAQGKSICSHESIVHLAQWCNHGILEPVSQSPAKDHRGHRDGGSPASDHPSCSDLH